MGDLICKFRSESPAVDRFCSIGKIGDKTFECYPLLDMLTHCCTLRHDSIIPAVFHDFAVVLASLLGLKGWTDGYKAAHHGYLEEPWRVCDTLQGAHLTDSQIAFLFPSRPLALGGSGVDFLHV